MLSSIEENNKIQFKISLKFGICWTHNFLSKAFYFSVIKHHEHKRTWGRKDLFPHTNPTSPLEARSATQGGKLDTGIGAKYLKECCLLISYSWFVYSAFLNHPETNSHRV